MLESILVGVLILCVTNVVLAVCMVIADATIGNYGEVTITINGDRRLKVDGGRSLLTTLKDERIFIPSACGGRGSCGLCKLRVLSGAGEALATELPWLETAERAAGVRLSCQVKVRGDLAIEIPEALFRVREYQARVTSLRDLTYDIKELKIQLIDPPTIDFKAGQYVQIEVPPYELTSEPIYRAYSVASDPVEQGVIELEIRYVPNGICTTYVHHHLKVGDAMTLNGPHGEFGLHEGTGEIICIAGGSGMAPIKSILFEMQRTGNARPVRYFFGARSCRDLFLVEEMRALEGRMPNLKFIPALSEPRPEDHWDGETGLITQVVDRHVTSVDGSQAYLCGSPLMIDACIKVLTAKGLPASQIYFDKFS